MVRSALFMGLLFALILSACSGTPTPTQASVTKPVPPPTQTSSPPTVPPSEAAPTVGPTASAAPTQAAACTDGAAFVADVTVPDNAQMDQGEAFTKIWRIRNTGDCTWTNGYTLIFKSGEQMGAPEASPLARETPPGSELDISVDLTAPAQADSFRADFEIHDPAGRAVPIDQETTLWVIIKVGTGSAGPINTPVPVPTSEATPAPEAGDLFAPATCAYSNSQPHVDSVITALNAYRAANGLAPLTLDSRLSVAAQAHSADMACNGLFMHRGSDGSSPTTRVAASGYAASGVTENVYGSYPPLNGPGVVSWWATDQVDPNHNANLLTTKYTQIGVGYAFFDEFGYYVVVFAAPQ